MSGKYEIFMAPVTEEQLKIGMHPGFPLQDIIDGKIDLADGAFLLGDNGEAIPIPYGGVKEYARKLVADGLSPQTKVNFGVTNGFTEEEQALFSKMSKKEIVEYLRKEMEEGRGRGPHNIKIESINPNKHP